MYKAPLGIILPSFLPVLLERGLPGYEDSELRLTDEERLGQLEIKSVIAASAFLGVESYAVDRDFETERVRSSLTASLAQISELSPDEMTYVLHLVDEFYSYKFIREDHPFDDWVCEAWWDQFQSIPYVYPSTMSDAIAYGLTISNSLRKCELAY
jgi:hypothetical protein